MKDRTIPLSFSSPQESTAFKLARTELTFQGPYSTQPLLVGRVLSYWRTF